MGWRERRASSRRVIDTTYATKQADGVMMPGSMSDGRGNRTLLRLAILAGALFMSVATVSAQSQVPSDSRLKSIIAKKVDGITERLFGIVDERKWPRIRTIGDSYDLFGDDGFEAAVRRHLRLRRHRRDRA